MNTIRRQLLQSLGAASTLALAPHSAAAAASTTAASAAALSVASFAALSATLNGYPAGDPGIAVKVRNAFATPARRAARGARAPRRPRREHARTGSRWGNPRQRT